MLCDKDIKFVKITVGFSRESIACTTRKKASAPHRNSAFLTLGIIGLTSSAPCTPLDLQNKSTMETLYHYRQRTASATSSSTLKIALTTIMPRLNEVAQLRLWTRGTRLRQMQKHSYRAHHTATRSPCWTCEAM